jgi:nitrate reductase NapE component
MGPLKRLRGQREGSESGQAAIETLLIFPVFLIIVLLAVDFGIWMYQLVTVSNAVREAARYGAVCGDDCDIVAKAVDRSNGVLSGGDVDVGFNLEGDGVVVKAARNYSFLFRLIDVTEGVSSCAAMRTERDPAGVSGVLDCSD